VVLMLLFSGSINQPLLGSFNHLLHPKRTPAAALSEAALCSYQGKLVVQFSMRVSVECAYVFSSAAVGALAAPDT
jgi:hypothetical protein